MSATAPENTTAANKTGKHQWRFSRLGGFDQVQLNNSQDLLALPELDQKLWAALSCPAHGLQIDGETLAFLDSDGDDRIRVPEITAAVQWTSRLLKNPDDLLKAYADLPLSAINESDEEGRQLLASAREILKNLGKSDASILTADDLADISKIFADTRFNGDGIIPAKAAGNDADRQLIEDIINCCGSNMDRCGEPGIDRDIIDRFFADLTLYADWWRQSQAPAPEHSPFKQNLDAAAEIFTPLKSKIDDYFTRCQLAEYDLRAGELLNPSVTAYEPLAGKDLTAGQPELAALPLANIAAGLALPLKHGVNPAWADRMAELRRWVITPLFGDIDALSFEQWRSISERFTDYLAWQQQKPELAVEPLGADRILAILEDGSRDRLDALIAEDEALAPEAEAMASVKKLLLYRRDLYKLLNNFVNFHDFYAVHADGIFQAGTLYIDGRDCQLCIRVEDIGKHSAMAALGGIYLAYCECRRNGGTEKITIAAAVTGGDADNLMLGRNGIFYDRTGRDWDATIVKIVEHPISIRQAFWAPYKRLARFVNEQVEKFAAAKDKETHTLASNHIAETGQTTTEAKPATPAPFDVGRFAGIFAAIGLAIGAIGTAVASLVGGFLNLAWWQMPLALFGIMLIISGPSMLMAFMKLRQRNLAPVLDASGWAINTKAYINIPFAGTLTGTAKLPANAVRELSDPFAEKARPWRLYLLLILLGAAVLALAQQQGYFNHWPPFSKIAAGKKS